MTQQVLQETLLEWLDAIDTLSIDVLTMDDLATPGATATSTLFVLEGTPTHLTQLWQLTKQLEAVSLVSFWEYITVEIEPQDYCWVLTVVLAVSSEAWSFLQEADVSEEDE